MAAKRVLIVLGKLKRGGAETLVMNIYRTIDRSVVQFDFIVHTPDRYDYDDEIESLGGKIYRFPQYNVLNHFEYKRCWNRFFAEHPEYRIIHAHMTGSASVFLPIAKKYGLVTIAHSHIALSQKGIRQKVIDLYRLPLKNQADYLFACSNDAGVWMFGEKATTRDNYYIIRNGVDTDKFAFSSDKRDKIRAELGLDGKFVIGNVSRFHIQKNHYLLIDVFAEIKKENSNAVLLLVGDGDLRGAIEEKVKSLGLADSVIFTGVRTDIDCILSAVDVFVMTSFNDLDGVPATANRWLLRNLLRDELGFGGFVVTDYGTIGELKAHGVAADDRQAAELALRAGVNMDMMSAAYLFHAAELVREGRIPESLIDSLCCEVLAVKFRLGLFDDPFRCQVKERERCYYAPEHLDAARRVARSSMVLLENRGGVLPLKEGSRIALVGPFADSRWDLIGSWVHFAEADRTSTFLDGLRARFGADRVTYARGCDPHKALEGGISEAVAAAAKS
ncbi:MAG: glycosyltransferase, partial [Ruminococcaceae bacterium]|nr:glycosyltransferase [Oscillospiraceae bacterium]